MVSNANGGLFLKACSAHCDSVMLTVCVTSVEKLLIPPQLKLQVKHLLDILCFTECCLLSSSIFEGAVANSKVPQN